MTTTIPTATVWRDADPLPTYNLQRWRTDAPNDMEFELTHVTGKPDTGTYALWLCGEGVRAHMCTFDTREDASAWVLAHLRAEASQ